MWSSRMEIRRWGWVGETVKSANLWFLFSMRGRVPVTDRSATSETEDNGFHPTWSNSNRFTPLLHIDHINLQIPEIREIHHTAVRDRRSPSVLLHARSRVPPKSEKVFTLSGVDDHASATFAGASFDVIDGGCDRVDEDRGDLDRLRGRWWL